MFLMLQRALHGEPVEVTYKGSSVKLVPAQPASKLARAKRQNALCCDPQAIVHSDAKLLARLDAQWRKEWSRM
jgi:antitoxin (DNA-binding transcriptional repressor) of toxin-antitoxin stability system